MYLSSSCQRATCGAGSTCDRGVCISDAVDPATLDDAPDDLDLAGVFPPSARPDAATQVADAGAMTDATTPADSGVAPDADGHPDATAPLDSGTPLDATAPQDGGAAMDASTPPGMLDWGRAMTSTASLYFTRSEVTVDQYAACVQQGACRPATFDTMTDDVTCNTGHAGRGDHPMNCVDWFGAEAFCGWVGGRLPTEQEWFAEASDRGARLYPWGTTPTATCTHVVMSEGGSGCGVDRTAPVCSKRLGDSVSGFCDLSGNVWEWTQTADAGRRVLRGGSWLNDQQSLLRASGRGRGVPTGRGSGNGFRCVRDAPP